MKPREAFTLITLLLLTQLFTIPGISNISTAYAGHNYHSSLGVCNSEIDHPDMITLRKYLKPFDINFKAIALDNEVDFLLDNSLEFNHRLFYH